MEPPYETIRVSQQGYIASIVLHRPDKLNAINQQMILELTAAVNELCVAASSGSLRAVVVTGGTGRAFAAGADIGEMAAMNVTEAGRFSEPMSPSQPPTNLRAARLRPCLPATINARA